MMLRGALPLVLLVAMAPTPVEQEEIYPRDDDTSRRLNPTTERREK